jgi:hypothetical protein
MLYGEAVQELARVRGQYEQFIIDRERERIIKLLNEKIEYVQSDLCVFWKGGTQVTLDGLIELINATDITASTLPKSQGGTNA